MMGEYFILITIYVDATKLTWSSIQYLAYFNVLNLEDLLFIQRLFVQSKPNLIGLDEMDWM